MIDTFEEGNHKLLTLPEVLKMKEEEVNALSYNCDFNRLTQLFGRALQLKYYKKANKREGVDGQQRTQSKYVNEEGDFLGDNEIADEHLQDEVDKDIMINTQAEGIQHGLEETNIDVHGFAQAYVSDSKQQNAMRDMFKVKQSRRFEAAGGINQHITLNAFAIRKAVDVKRLKIQL